MEKPFIPLSYEVRRIRHGEIGRDALNNVVYGETNDPLMVAAWWSSSSAEPKVAGHERLVVDVEIIAAPGDFREGDEIDGVGDYGRLKVVGHPEDYRHGPWWDPGLVVVNCRREDR